ncbi:MAG: ABC transporter ATP-binding protein [Candidatus Fervidibacter sp.]|uniref:ABC transporter ATP-binding protein n=1 Tax=Candidatus Fervidibacter sp. TaxID=3100871 RepID=UPI00404A4D92
MLLVENLTVRSGEFVLREVSLVLGQGECGVVVGPSGAGKSTFLEAVAGLRKVESGRIVLKGRDITNLPPEQRGIAFVPQDYALFPHLTAQGNILLAPRLLGMPKDKVVRRFEFLCDLLNLKELLHRRPKQLSGGERQRVALARALMLEPQLLLLDEPFAALDPQMRPSIRRSLRRIFQTLRTTVLIVTHDIWDAAALGDQVFVIENGLIVQKGSWAEIIKSPESDFIVEFVSLNRLVGEVVWREGKSFLKLNENSLLPVKTNLPDGTKARLQFFPSQVRVVGNEKDAWRGTVSEVIVLGDRTRLSVSLSPDLTVLVEVDSTSPQKVGDRISFVVTEILRPL